MGFDDGHVILDRQDHNYFTGDTVHGKLVFQQDKVKKFRGIYVLMKGYCDVHWTTTRTYTTRGANGRRVTHHQTIHHNSHETYFEQKVYLSGGESGEHHINPGSYEFPFQCFIPLQCPSSYEGSYGHIRYELRFVVDRAFKFDQEKVITYNVIAKRDLNDDPYCKEPAVFEFVASYCCWCMNVGSCIVNARLPASGYCAGQIIRIDLSCENNSNVEIKDIKLELKEETTFRAVHNPGYRHEKNVVAKITKGPIPGSTTRTYTVEMEVPNFDVRNVDACKYIDVDYEFEVTVSPSGCHRNDSASRRIILGHIPLREFEGDSQPPDQLKVTPGFPSQPYPGVVSPPTVPYPGTNYPYPDASTPYPGPNSPYPGTNPPYPATNSPYPEPSPPYPGPNTSFMGANAPYPGANENPTLSIYPSPNPASGLTMPTDNKDGENVPLIPPGMTSPYPSGPPQLNPNAPEPSTPDFYKPPPAYNPDFKDDKN